MKKFALNLNRGFCLNECEYKAEGFFKSAERTVGNMK